MRDDGRLTSRFRHPSSVIRHSSLADGTDEVGDSGDIAGADNHVYEGGAAPDLRVLYLGHAAADADDHLRPLQLHLAQLAELAVDLLFRLPAHGAGVEEHNVGLCRVVD